MRKIQTYITIVLVLSTFFSWFSHAKAIGPVIVELNKTGDFQGSTRANTIVNCKIFFHFNVDIKVNDWIKVWLPLEEAQCDPAKFCGYKPEVNGNAENPRFVPNDSYFSKYPKSDEKKYGKLYEVVDAKTGATNFLSCSGQDGNCCPDSNCKSEAQKTNFGKILLGTVLPKLPRDDKERKRRLAMILRSISIGFTPCTECRGLPILKNTCKERSIQTTTPLEVEAWRKGYNPADYNISRTAGILFPASPGLYRVLVATKGEPAPVESEAFILTCSQISAPKVTLTSAIAGKNPGMKITFGTGEGGALDKNVSTITVKLPQEMKVTKEKSADVTINGEKIIKPLAFNKENNSIVFVCPKNINSSTEIEIIIGSDAGIVNPVKPGKYQIEVWTSSEPDPVKSGEFEIAAK